MLKEQKTHLAVLNDSGRPKCQIMMCKYYSQNGICSSPETNTYNCIIMKGYELGEKSIKRKLKEIINE